MNRKQFIAKVREIKKTQKELADAYEIKGALSTAYSCKRAVSIIDDILRLAKELE